MEYVQMTLNDWVQMKQKLKQELLGVKQSFVRIGYTLRKIEDQRLYEQDGYKSIAEFAKAEYGLEPSTTSRFMSINREYSIDGYSEILRPEFADLGRSQLEEMLKLPESDRQMIQPETSREDIRELKRFNKTEPAAGVADDIRQLVEKFYKENPDVLNEVFNEEFEEQTIKRFAEIVNPGGNRSYKKGLFFLMMYENRVAVKKFGDTPQDLTWWQFYQITVDIFGDAAAGPKTWQRYFGGEDEESGSAGDEEIYSADNSGDSPDGDVPENDTEPADEDGRGGEDDSGSSSGNGTDNIKPISADEDDSGADGENGIEDEPENQKGTMGDYGAISETGAGKTENDTAGEESGKGDCQEPTAGETTEPAGAESQGEEIAPAQKSAEILEREAFDEVENGENHGAAEGETSEPETEETAGEETKETESSFEAMNQPEIIEKPYGSRKDYIDTLTAYGMAMYMAEEYKRHNLKASSLAFPSELEKWLLQEVDENGRTIEEA